MEKKGLKLATGLKLVAAAGVAALVMGGCGASNGANYNGQHPDYKKTLAGAPAPLAALYMQGSELLPGGAEAFEKRLASVRGYPAVVNVWASWCGPCRYEFPTLQKLSATYGKRVAFLGVDKEDSESLAKEFLTEAPLPYPSYTDPHQEIAHSIGTGPGIPDTAFYDRAGSLCYLKLGPFTKQSELAAYVQRFALREECESG